MRETFRRPMSPVILAGFLVVAAMVGASLWFAHGQVAVGREATRLFRHDLLLSRLLEAIKNAETAQRGYLLTGDEAYWRSYLEGLATVRTSLPRVAAAEWTGGPNVAASLRPLLAAKINEMESTVRLEQQGRRAEALAVVQTELGVDLMRRINNAAAKSRQRSQGRIAVLAGQGRLASTMLSTGLIAGFVGIVVLALLWYRDNRRRFEALALARDAAQATSTVLQGQIEAREKAENQVRQMQKMEAIGQLTGGIAHDFNNMLAIVIGSLDMARRRMVTDPSRVMACIDNARNGADRAAQLTQRLLAFSRQQPLAPKPLDANTLVGGMSEMLRRTLGEPIRIETVLAGGLWRTYADPIQLENAILNLAVNARDAMPDGGRLTIETQNAHLDDDYARTHDEVEAGQYVCICVSDTGSGMAAETIERAFEPFFTTKATGKGTGLGLSQVFGFVKQSGGHVKIYSELGQGSAVKLYLPRWFGQDIVVADTDPELLPAGSVEEFVLVVEDEARVRHMSIDTLRELGYTVIQAADANQALAQLRLHPRVDLMFTDIVMPGMNGRRLVEMARVERPALKVLYTTGYTRNAVVHNGMLDPGVAFLAKPFTMDQLARKVREVLDGGGVNRSV